MLENACWMIFGWAMKNPAITFWGYAKNILWGHETLVIECYFLKLKRIDIVKSWPGPGQKYNLLYSTTYTHPVSLCS